MSYESGDLARLLCEPGRTLPSFESDRERDASTLAAGHLTVRMTWERMHQRAAREAARLESILKQRRSQAA